MLQMSMHSIILRWSPIDLWCSAKYCIGTGNEWVKLGIIIQQKMSTQIFLLQLCVELQLYFFWLGVVKIFIQKF